MTDKIKQVALEEVDTVRTLAKEGLRSAAYLYPIRVKSTFYIVSLPY